MDKGGHPVYYGNPVDAVTYFKKSANYVNPEESGCSACGNVNAEQPLQIDQHPIVAVGWRKDPIHKVRSGNVETLLGNLGLIEIQEVIGFVAEQLGYLCHKRTCVRSKHLRGCRRERFASPNLNPGPGRTFAVAPPIRCTLSASIPSRHLQFCHSLVICCPVDSLVRFARRRGIGFRILQRLGQDNAAVPFQIICCVHGF